VPIPDLTIALAAQVAVDNVLLGMLSLTLPMPAFSEAERIRDEAQEALALFRERGWLEKPESYHRTPPPLESPTVRPRPMLGLDVEHLSFESGYEPHAEEPGRERWLGYERNRTAHAWVLRHDAPERPWLCCIHGYQMGNPKIDLRAFEVARLHHSMGMNVILPVLPLHGPRAYGRISGDGFLSADFMDTVHAEAQAMWDIRRALSWARAQGATKVGAFGLSLGGYNTALLACLDEDLACAIPGIPATDFARITWRHGPPLQLRYSETIGVKLDDVDALLRVVSPLALEPKVDHERRYLFGAVGDLLVPAELVRDLWRHWDRPRLEWYQGGHVTFGAHPQIRRLVDSALRESGLTP